MSGTEITLVLVDPQVLRLKASQQSSDEPHVNWYVGFAPEREAEIGARVVFGTLHAAGEDGMAEVTVAGMMRYPEDAEPGNDAFPGVLAESDALETLYDVARIAFRTVAAVPGLDIEIPAAAPEAEISELVRRDDEDEDEDKDKDKDKDKENT